jgi:hypothetical protein
MNQTNQESIEKVLDINPYKLPKAEVMDMIEKLSIALRTMAERLNVIDADELQNN